MDHQNNPNAVSVARALLAAATIGVERLESAARQACRGLAALTGKMAQLEGPGGSPEPEAGKAATLARSAGKVRLTAWSGSVRRRSDTPVTAYVFKNGADFVFSCCSRRMPVRQNVSPDSFHRVFVPSKAGARKRPTKPVRVHQDVAELLEQLAFLFGQTVPDFASGLLRRVLEDRLQKAAQLLLQKRKELKSHRYE
jgi:hypothetical protein